MNLYLEYLRYLYPLVLFCIPLWLMFKSIQACRKGDKANASKFIAIGFIASFLLMRTVAGTAVLALFIAMPPSEAVLINELQKEAGVQLPPNAKVTSYRTNGGLFGYWSGFLKAEVACQDIEQLSTLSGTLFDSQTPLEVRPNPQVTKLDVWRKSRFTIPAGSRAVEYNDAGGSKQTIYAVDSKNCAVYYHRFEID